jgi:hypothetical protein
MPGTVWVRNYHLQRDLLWHCRMYFPAWPLPYFARLRHRPERNDRDD